jgi:thiosulfate dehydrogenase
VIGGILLALHRLVRTHLFTALLLVSFFGGCAAPRDAATDEHSLADQREPLAIDAVFSHPTPDSIPEGQRGEQIRMGYHLVVHTQEFAAPYVGNALTCANCDPAGGLDPNSASYVGLSRVYPEYRARTGRVVRLADRINECSERGLNGKATSRDSHKLQAIVA